MFIRRRIGLVTSLVEECGLQVQVSLVPSESNKADALTRVPQRWLKTTATPAAVCMAMDDASIDDLVKRVHDTMVHPGVRRTLYFVKRVNSAVTRREVHSVVTNCHECQSIDPAPVKWRKGSLVVDETWKRVGMDVTHYGGRSYLSLIDWGRPGLLSGAPCDFKQVRGIMQQLEAVFL
ncbi:hypothetical protein GWK47_034553 [Chionoecetes opilio]|uniref:Integrase zinc-binding domain-containing protein n=1 Tax=Chionoecetes opilio TaxID=41210 RepID=A0A8J4YR74_CHIOP|nr:hypothetical protein GWK47_034553 [Chionoecetes opilio]